MGPIIFVDRSFRVIDASESARIFFDIESKKKAVLTEISDIFSSDRRGQIYSIPETSAEIIIKHRGEELSAKVLVLPESSSSVKAVIYIDEVRSEVAPLLSPVPENNARLVELGTIAGSIAHDLNNLLMAVLGHISYLRLTADGPIDDSLRSAEDGAKKASQLSKQILDFAKIDDANDITEIQPVDICELTKNSIPLLSPNLPIGVTISLKCPDSPLFVNAKESQITQILLNLIVNARDAMPQGGSISIELGAVQVDTTGVIHGFNLEVGPYVRLIVSDTGSGISEEVQARMFEPFFTTKKGTGTGLGLATVFLIIKDLKGAIDVKSRKNNGSVFSLVLPLAKMQKVSEAEPKESERYNRRGEKKSGLAGRILIVDDEDSIRLVLERSLELIGYAALSAENGSKAIELFKEHHASIELVIMDMIMPGIPGSELYYLLKQINPEVKVLISSGYSSDQKTKQLIKDGALGLIQKPFSVEELLETVKTILF